MIKEQCGGTPPTEFDSGYTLANPDQEIYPDQLNDPDFIASIVTQVLQQLRGGEQLEEWAPHDDIASIDMEDMALDDMWHHGIVAPYNPCGPIVPQLYSSVKPPRDPDIWGQYKSREQVREGSCGYTETPGGQKLSTPGGTKGMSAYDRTQKMLKKYIQQEVKKIKEGMSPEEWANAKEAERLAQHPERDKIGKIQQMMGREELDKIEKGVTAITGGGRHHASVSDEGDKIKIKFSYARGEFDSKEWDTIINYLEGMGYFIIEANNYYEKNWEPEEPAEAVPTIHLKKSVNEAISDATSVTVNILDEPKRVNINNSTSLKDAMISWREPWGEERHTVDFEYEDTFQDHGNEGMDALFIATSDDGMWEFTLEVYLEASYHQSGNIGDWDWNTLEIDKKVDTSVAGLEPADNIDPLASDDRDNFPNPEDMKERFKKLANIK